jgi:hypothetical protein
MGYGYGLLGVQRAWPAGRPAVMHAQPATTAKGTAAGTVGATATSTTAYGSKGYAACNSIGRPAGLPGAGWLARWLVWLLVLAPLKPPLVLLLVFHAPCSSVTPTCYLLLGSLSHSWSPG